MDNHQPSALLFAALCSTYSEDHPFYLDGEPSTWQGLMVAAMDHAWDCVGYEDEVLSDLSDADQERYWHKAFQRLVDLERWSHEHVLYS